MIVEVREITLEIGGVKGRIWVPVELGDVRLQLHSYKPSAGYERVEEILGDESCRGAAGAATRWITIEDQAGADHIEITVFCEDLPA